MSRKQETITVIVTGDVIIDWNIAWIQRKEGITQAWNAENLAAAFCQHGGAAMMGELVTAIAGNLNQKKQTRVEVHQINLPRQRITPADPHIPQSYAMWSPFKRDERSGEKVWRVQEFLGLKPVYETTSPKDPWKNVTSKDITPNLVVISDDNLGFRQNSKLWPAAIKSKTAKPWILVNTARPVAQGELWEYLGSNHSTG